MIETKEEIKKLETNWFQRKISKSNSSNSNNLAELHTITSTNNNTLNNKIIQLEKMYSKGIYFLNDGRIKTYRSTNNGKEFITKIYKKGDFFGYASVNNNEKIDDFAMALEDSTVYLIPKEDFKELLIENSFISKKTSRILAKKGNQENQQLKSTLHAVRKRITDAIRTLSKKNENELDNAIEYESTKYALKQLKTKSLIKIKKGGISIITSGK